MSHVDEGLLHAYLDGALPPGDAPRAEIEAHLAVCADCRTRLEHEREVRNAAIGILGRAEPGPLVVPDFDAIRRRSASTESTKSKGRRLPVVPLSLAASLVVAIGAGIIVNELRQQNIVTAPVAVQTAQRPPAAAPPELARQNENQQEALKSEIPPAQIAQSEARNRPAPPSAGPAMSGAEFSGEGVADKNVEPPAALAAGAEPKAIGADAASEWRVATRAEAEKKLGRAIVTISGLPVAGIEVATSAADARVRVRQSLGAGGVIALIEQPAVLSQSAAAREGGAAKRAPSAPAANSMRMEKAQSKEADAPAKPERQAFSSATTEFTHDNVHVQVMSTLPADSVAALLRRVQ